MIRSIAMVCMVLALGACSSARDATPVQTIVKPEVVMPPKEFFICPELPPILDKDYTQKEVALLLIETIQVGELCKKNLKAIEEFLIKAKKTTEETPR